MSWQEDFFKSTGFAQSLPRPLAPPPSVKSPPPALEGFFQNGQRPVGHGPIPNSVTTGNQPVLPGKMPAKQFPKPFPTENVLLHKDGSVPTYPTEQTGWQAPGIGNVVNTKSAQSKNISHAVAKGGYVFSKERMSAASTKDKVSLGLVSGSFLCGLGYVLRRNKKTKEPAIWLLFFFLFAVLAAVSNFTGLFSDPEKQGALPKDMDGAKTITLKNVRDPNPYPAPVLPSDTIADRFAAQKTNTASLEGPRRDMGYYRGDPTPDGMPVLKDNILMRSASQWNMDKGTFDEYMRRLNGENIPQIVQSHPYYAVNAAFEERGQINDSDTIYGIADTPSQSLRKSPYRQPRIQQAGAKTMHLKNPPPGAVRPLEKVHPWLSKEEPTRPAIIADSLVSSSDNQMTYAIDENQEGVDEEKLHHTMESSFDDSAENAHDNDEFAAQFGLSAQAKEESIAREVSDKPMRIKK